MARPVKRLEGKRFGKLVVVEESGRRHGKVQWLCRCDCGMAALVVGSRLTVGTTKSCGCLKYEHPGGPIRHGRTKTAMYGAWRAMRRRVSGRTSLANAELYAHVDMDPRWGRFENFLADMGERPPGMTIDRVDASRGYWPDNCRWATPAEQTANRRPKRTMRATRAARARFAEAHGYAKCAHCQGTGWTKE